MGLRDDILAADDLPTVAVEVSEWGVTVYVRSMTGTERDDYEIGLMETKDLPLKEKLHNMRAKLIVRTVVNEDGSRMFSDADIDLVGAKSAAALSKVAKAAQKLNGLTDEELNEIAGN